MDFMTPVPLVTFLASILSWKYESIIYSKKLLANYLVEDADCHVALYTRQNTLRADYYLAGVPLPV